MKRIWKRNTAFMVLLTVLLCNGLCASLMADDELVGHWRFNEGTGTSTADYSDAENDGTLYNMTFPWTNGIMGYALSFDGTDDYIDCGSNSSLDLASTGTLSAWIKLDSYNGLSGIISKGNGVSASPMSYALYLRDSGGRELRWWLCDGTNSLQNNFDTIPSLDTWYHVVLTWDGDYVRAYVNGIEEPSSPWAQTVTPQTGTDQLLIGAFTTSSTSGYNFDGDIDGVRIYNYALSVDAIDTLYQETTVIGSWKMDEGTGTLASDSSEYGNYGTLNNMDSSDWINRICGYALSFDGTDDYVDCGSNSSLDLASTGTLSAWIKLDSYNGLSAIISKGNSVYVSSMSYALYLRDSGGRELRWWLCDGTNSLQNNFDTIPSLDTWYHVVLTWDGDYVRAYVNGIEEPSSPWAQTVTPQTGTDQLLIGAFTTSSTSGYNFDGDIDKVTIYNYALNADEIDILCQKTAVVGSWKMDKGTGTLALDSSKYGNDGTLNNMDSSDWVVGNLNNDGYFRTALSFDGTDDYVDCGSNSSLDLASTGTLSAWIKLDSYNGLSGIISKGNGVSASPMSYALYLRDSGGSKLRWWLCDGTNSLQNNFDTIPSLDTWYHVALTWDGDDVRAYVNGVEEASSPWTQTVTPQTGTNQLLIGAFTTSSTSGYNFDGDIDKVAIYNRTLTSNEIKAMQLFSSALPDRNYYTGENAVATVSLNITEDAELIGCYLVAKDSQDNSLGTNNYPSKITDLTYSTSSLSSGINIITIELRKNSGELICAYNMDIMKRAVNTGNEVKIDFRNNYVIRNSTPFFPIGISMVQVPSSATSDFQAVASAGFNSILRTYSYGAPSDSTTYLENAALSNLLVIDSHDSYTGGRLAAYLFDTEQDFLDAYDDERDDILDAVGYAKQETNLLSHFAFDEVMPIQASAGEDLYNTIYGLGDYLQDGPVDAYHPTLAFIMPSSIVDSEYVSSLCDILGTDVYVRPPRVSGNLVSSVDWVTKYTCIAKEQAVKYRKAFWMLLCAEYPNATKRIIKPDEQRCQSWLALIHGAKGIFYYFYPIVHKDSWDNFSVLTSDLADLSPSMLTPDLDQTITYYNESVTTEFDPQNDTFVDVQVSLRKAPAGESYDYVLLATNTREYSIDVDYAVSLLGTSGTVGRLFDTTTYTVTNGEFSDTLVAFATRAYTFSSTSSNPVTIAVDITPQGTYTEETVYTYSGRPNMTNIMQNPSLDDNSVTNWPDYLRPWYVGNRVNSTNQDWGLEVNSPHHGSKCLKITRTNASLQLTGAYFALSPQHTDINGKDYTFSIYMKTDAAGVATGGIHVDLGGLPLDALDETDAAPYNVTVNSTSWIRYEYKVNIPANFATGNIFYVKVRDIGSVWFDAIQIEQASSATTFTTN